MVGNDICSAPAWRAANSISAATSISFTPGRKTSTARSNNFAPKATAARVFCSSFSSFTMRARSTIGGASFKARPDGVSLANRFLSATVKCSASMPMCHALRRRRRPR